MLPTKSSSLSNHSSCSQSLRHMLWSDQSSSTNSSLPRVGTSPRTIIHPQPLRGMRSGLLKFRSPSPEQQGSMMGQKGSQTTMDETNDLLMHSSMHPTRCNSRLSYMNCEPAGSSPKCNKSRSRGDSRSDTTCASRICQDPSFSCVTYHRQRLPDLTHTSVRSTPSERSRSPATEERACDEQTMATRGSTTRQSSPATDIIDIDDDALSSELPSEIDPQELLDFLREFDHDRQRSKKADKTRPGPQPSATHCDNSVYSQPSDGAKAQIHRKVPTETTASDMAQPPWSREYPSQRPTSRDDFQQQSPCLSANESTSLVVNPADSPPAVPKPESRYRPPELFIGRFASELPNPRKSKTRRRSTRPDIRTLPNYDADPIDEET